METRLRFSDEEKLKHCLYRDVWFTFGRPEEEPLKRYIVAAAAKIFANQFRSESFVSARLVRFFTNLTRMEESFRNSDRPPVRTDFWVIAPMRLEERLRNCAQREEVPVDPVERYLDRH